jgi:polysaccharide pyruvyl transferase WcaK-like protein
LSPRVPSRDEFGFEETHLSGHVAAPMAKLIGDLLAQPDVTVTLYHDETPAMESAVHTLIPATARERVTALSPVDPIEKLRESMAGCEVVFSCSLHGLMLAATAGVPVIGLQAETGAREFLRTLLPESDTWLLPAGADGAAFDAAFALQRIAAARAGAATLREAVANKLKVLVRKEAQNGRMLELLVPRRDRRTDRGPIGGTARDDDDDSGEAPGHPPPHRRKFGARSGATRSKR